MKVMRHERIRDVDFALMSKEGNLWRGYWVARNSWRILSPIDEFQVFPHEWSEVGDFTEKRVTEYDPTRF